MTRTSFNDGWTVRPKTSVFDQIGRPAEDLTRITLPHDALFAEPRSADNLGKTAYFPREAAYEYAKTFEAPEEYRTRRVSLEFQGAYRDAMVYVNGEFAGQRPYGYTTFLIALDDFLHYGQENSIRVDVRAHDDSRWYTGVGITRDVVLVVTELVHLSSDGVRVTTPDIDDERAVVELEIRSRNDGLGTTTVVVETEILDATGSLVARESSPVTLRAGSTETARHRVYVADPHRWSVDDPYLYTAVVTVRQGDRVIDRQTISLGIRSLRLDPLHGLRINDEVIKLRGACIHHDNGLLGGSAIGRAEERRVELLKAAGFNAIRSAHNPMSQAMLDACDRVGMLVMDETFDIWTSGKSSFDYSLSFPEWWERDVEAMVLKDLNHPSVIMYSIGNEILEIGQPIGAAWGRHLAEKVRSIDSTRFVTNGVNGFVAGVTDVIEMMQQPDGGGDQGMMDMLQQRDSGGNQGVNEMMASFEAFKNRFTASPLVVAKTAESMSTLDVAGMNYDDGRYLDDRERFPNQVIVGTETFPGHIAVLWPLVEGNSHVIGDFTWVGWDYLGEVGIGRTRFTDQAPEYPSPYPWLTAWSGDLDITGNRRTISYFREIVFGLRREPYIAVTRPQDHGRQAVVGGWAWTDSLGTWTWAVDPGSAVTVEVYSDADEVELLVNGATIGRQPVGADAGFRASFETSYEPGEILAIAYRGGIEDARTTLVTADAERRLVAIADRSVLRADDSDLAFVTIQLQDSKGTVVNDDDRTVHVSVSGSGELLAVGTGRPDYSGPMLASECDTFDGRALAIVRPQGPGEIIVTVTADGLEAVELRLTSAVPA